MQTVQDYATMKSQLEEKVANLKQEKDSVQREIEVLSQKVALKELEKQAKALEGELDGLKGKRSVLEQKLVAHNASPAQMMPPQQRPPIRPVGQ